MSPTVVLIWARAIRRGFMETFSRKRAPGERGRDRGKGALRLRRAGIVGGMDRSLYNRDYKFLLAANFLYSLYATVFIFLPAFLYGLGVREGEIGLVMATGVFA